MKSSWVLKQSPSAWTQASESWRVSLEGRHVVWNIFYLLSTFSNAFSGIKIHKCDICILRYLMLFIFLPGSQSEHLFRIYFLPLNFFLIVQRALVFLTPCMETLVKFLVVLVILILSFCAVLFEMETESELYTELQVWKNSALIHCTIVLIVINTLT